MIKYLSEIFDDWLTRSALIVFVLIVALTIINITNLADNYPLLGVFIFSMVPILFIAGGVIFVLAILRS